MSRQRGAARARSILWLGLVLSAANATATTWREVTATCPICQSKVTGSIPGSTFIPGVSPDFRPLGVGVDIATESILLCRKCGFAAAPEDFEKPDGLEIEKVRNALAGAKPPTLFRKLDGAATVVRSWTNNPQVLARLALAAKWLADDTGETALIRQRITDAIDAHKAVLGAGDLKPRVKAAISYLIGELYGQAGSRQQALEWFAQAERGADGQLAWMVQRQAFLARHEGSPHQAVLEAAMKAPDGAKLAAVKLLREANEPEAIAFLKDFCLSCRENLREDAIRDLVGKAPKAYHLPIFLDGLRSAHFRTVQGSARAVEVLRAPEAAPLIVEALENPPEFTEFCLREALGAVATDKELDYLVGQLGRERGRCDVLNGLLNTRSPKAVPHILRLLKEERGLAESCEHDALALAAAFGPSLLDRLPDLKAAPQNDDLALFKARVLGVSKSPEAEKELAGALTRWDTIGVEAASALALRGNDAGREILLWRLDRVRIHTILRPGDFDRVNEHLQKEKARDKALDEQLAADSRKILDDPKADEGLKQMARRDLERSKWDEDKFMRQWVIMLGATRNPKARPICLKYLESPNRGLRAEAARALTYVYDDAVGEALVKRLSDDVLFVRDEVIRALGRAGDKRHAGAIAKLVEEPTLVQTKLAWMEAMAALAPDKALPVLKLWCESPNDDLAAAAKSAVRAIEDKRSPKP
ncbi:MAG: DUF2225 domain-containing protein [Planctomycetes bacterium]|nr:DUF2225 domain-containing protein [Planctomycetota bacterium]